MINLYLSPSCTSCRKARAWLDSYGVAYEEHNILTQPMTSDDLKAILSKTENGTEDIIFFWIWDKDIYLWSSAGKSGTIFSGRGDGTEWI